MDKSNNGEQIPKKDFLEMIARMYYVLGMKQKDIADQVGIGRSSVARFLNEAKEEGVVRFFIASKTESSRSLDLETEMIKKYKLTDAIVIKDNDNSLFEVTVANYLNSILPFNGAIGIGGGKTMNYLSTIMNICESRPNLKIIQTIGGFSNGEGEMPSTAMVQNWAQSLEANPLFLPAPAIVEDKETKDFYLKNKNISDVYDEIKKIEVLIVGIGSMNDINILKKLQVEDIDTNLMHEKSVGDINLHFFDEKGRFSMPNLSERVMGLSPEDFKEVPTRIGLAYGKEKVKSIKAALGGKLVNIFVTTSATAKLLLQEDDE